MVSKFKYRFKSPLGGLAADLTAEQIRPGASEEFSLQVYGNVRLVLPQGINWRDAAWLSFGLSVHSLELNSAQPVGVKIRVTSLTFPLAHFRSEVAALAMDGWIREEFELPDRDLHAIYDREGDGYRFHWGEYSNPFSDES